MERDALGAHERDELGNIAGNNGEARSSRARVGGLVRDRRRIAASADDRGAGSNAGRQSASRPYCFWHSSGRSRQKRAAHRYSRRPSALRSGRLGDGGDGRNRRGVRETDLSTGTATLQSTANVRRLSAWLTESMSRVHICENYGASGIRVGSLVEFPAGSDAVEGVNRPDVTPSTALLRLSYNRKNQVPRTFELLGAPRRSRNRDPPKPLGRGARPACSPTRKPEERL